jgi:hypothetical protein
MLFAMFAASACAGQRARIGEINAMDAMDGASIADTDAGRDARDDTHDAHDARDARAAIVIAPRPRPKGTLRFEVRDARDARPVAAHIAVRGLEGTPDPDLGPRHRADGALQSRIAATGQGVIELAAGVYRVTFDHGLEWSIFSARVEITAERETALTGAIEHVLPMDDWTACDLHVHAERSFDSRVSIVDRVAALAAVGIEFATPTEHNVVGDYTEGVRALPESARRPRGRRSPGLVWVNAVEVTTDRAPFPIGHFNVFPYRPDPRRADGGPPDYLATPSEIFRQARANTRDAIVQVNHPRMEPNIGFFTRSEVDPRTNRSPSPRYDPGYDAIEVFNGYYLGVPAEVDRVVRDWLALLSSGARYVGTANSDSHHIAYEAAGYPRTYVLTPRAGDASPPADTVLRSLRQGHAFGTSGPMLLVTSGRAGPGDTVRISRTQNSARVRVIVRAAPWVDVDIVELYRDAELVATVAVPPSTALERAEAEVDIAMVSDRHSLVAIARGDRSLGDVLPRLEAKPFAFTNPIWLVRR